MLGFGKRKKRDDETDEVLEPVGKKKKDKKADKKGRKRSEGLASVLKETVMDQVMTSMRTCPRFVVHHNGELYHVGLMLDVDSIGGLSRKKRDDEGRGALVEDLDSGRIEVIVTANLLANQRLVIIPSAKSFSIAVEHKLLRDAIYQVCFVSDDGRGIYLTWDDDQEPIDITLDQAMEIAEADGDDDGIVEFFEDAQAYWACDELAAPVDDYGDDGDDAYFEGDEFDDEEDEPIDLDEPDSNMTQAMPKGTGEEPVPAPVPLEGPEARPAPAQPQAQSHPQPQPAPQPQMPMSQQPEPPRPAQPQPQAPQPAPERPAGRQVEPKEWFEAARSRYFSDDLGIEVSFDRFDAQFAQIASHCVGFAETSVPGQGFIPEYLDGMRRNANADLRRLHRDNMRQLRLHFGDRLAESLVGISRSLDLAGESEFSKAKQAIDEHLEEQKAASTGEIEARRHQLQALFDAAADQAGLAAEQTAKAEYRARYGAEHQRKLSQVALDVLSDIEAEHADELTELYDRRRDEAALLVERVISDLIAETSELYRTEMQPAENELFERHRQAMAEWLEQNRAADVAYVQATREKLERDNSVARAQAEAKAQVERVAAEARAESERYARALDEARRAREEAVSDLERKHKVELDRIIAEKADLADRLERAQDGIVHAGDDAEKRAQDRVKLLEDRLTDRDNDIARLERSGRMRWWIFAAILVVCIVAGVCMGLVYGLNNYAQLMSALS